MLVTPKTVASLARVYGAASPLHLSGARKGLMVSIVFNRNEFEQIEKNELGVNQFDG
jgi:hypothetical protein